MPDGERLRELQRRAYSPGGGLTPAEARELDELQAAVRATVEPSPVAPPSPVDPATREQDETRSGAEKVSDSQSVAEPETVSSRPAPVTPRKAPRLLLAAVVAASALLIGLGAGWLLFGRDSGPALDAKQQDAWTEFEASGKYDPGSIRMLGEQYGITAWYATQGDAKTECVMLTPSKQVSIGCLPVDRNESEEQGFQTPLSTQVAFEDDKGTVVNGVVVRDVRGAPTAVMQKWESQTSNWSEMFQGEERDIAELIVRETGATGDFLQIAGYDGDTPIWLTQDGETCLYVADLGGVRQQSCDPDSTKVVIELPNASYGVRDTNQGAKLTTLSGRGSSATGDPIEKTPE